jgi:transcriptional regulator with XRE-family HTH domain
MRNQADAERALKLVERLVKISPSRGLELHAKRLQQRLNAIPMAKVLAKVEAGSISAKARMLGVTRQAIYYWLNDVTRPNEEQAKTLAKLTGFSVDEIRGRDPDAA